MTENQPLTTNVDCVLDKSCRKLQIKIKKNHILILKIIIKIVIFLYN